MSRRKTKLLDKYALTHDAFFEETFGMPSLGVAFLKAKLPRKLKKHLDIDKLTVVKTKFRDVLFRETRPDIVYKVPIRGTDEHVHFHVIMEHKSFDDHSAIYQIWQYVAQLCVQDVVKRLTDPKTKQRKAWPKNFSLSPIIPIIIHHGSKPFTGKTQLAELFYQIPGAKEYLPHLQAILVDLSTIEVDQLPRDPNAPELYVVLLIMKVVFSKDKKTLKRQFHAILDELQPYSQNPKYYELIRKFWYYTLHNAKNLTKQDCYELESSVQKSIGDEKMPTLTQMFFKDGMKKGIEKGMEKGIEQGEVKREIRAILRTLTKRFQSVPKPLEEQVRAITGLARLEQLADFAFDCESLDEFAGTLKYTETG